MRSTFRNQELKEILIKFIIVQLIFLFAFGVHQYFTLNRVKEGVVDSQAVIVGKLITSYPQLENEIVGLVTKGINDGDIARGRELLKAYGYTKGMALLDEPIMNKYSVINTLNLIILLILYTLSIGTLIFIGYKKIYKKVNDINRCLEEIQRGNFNMRLPEGEEGDFSILGHHFNNMSQIINQNLELLKQERSFLRDIISDISHQLKTPMSSLIILNDLILDKKEMEESTREDFLNKTRIQLNKLSWLIKSLLKLARLEGRAILYNKRDVELTRVITNAITSLKSLAEEKNINITIRDDKKTHLICDEEWTSEAIQNILKNCIEHTKEKGNIAVTIEGTPISAVINIRDDGEGICEGDLPHIFERFYKGSNSPKEDSIGIGLALSKSIIEGQGGEIRATSELGRGTEFRITFLRGIL